MSESVAGAVARVQAYGVIIDPTLAAIRDIPRSCICDWDWLPGAHRHQLARSFLGCPWHGHGLRKMGPWSPERQW